eukprot:m.89620 g.89620  ORF g.89620 m.89620 type:complete len:395 (-) comp14979_c0_seq1:116-1300(-)
MLQSTPSLMACWVAGVVGCRLLCQSLGSESSGNVLVGATTYVVMVSIAVRLVRNIVLVPLQFVPAIFVAKALDVTGMRSDFLAKKSDTMIALGHIAATRTKVNVGPGVDVDGMVLRNERLAASETSCNWIIFLNANGVPYEQNLEFLATYSDAVGAHILTFNYRGVGSSSGWPHRAEDLVADGQAVLRHLVATGVPKSRITLHGHSLGGAVAAMLWEHHPEIKVINDRSFRSMHDEVDALLKIGLGNVMGIALGIVAGFNYWVLAWVAGPFESRGFFYSLVVGGLVGWALAVFGRINVIAPHMLDFMGWRMDAMAASWSAERSLVMFHQRDGVIPYNEASLVMGLSAAAPGRPINSFELQQVLLPQNCHMHPLHLDMGEWNRVTTAIRSLLRNV